MTSPQLQSIQVLTNPPRSFAASTTNIQSVSTVAPAITTVLTKIPATPSVVSAMPSTAQPSTTPAPGPTLITQIKTEAAPHMTIAAQSPIAVKHAQQQAIQVRITNRTRATSIYFITVHYILNQ